MLVIRIEYFLVISLSSIPVDEDILRQENNLIVFARNVGLADLENSISRCIFYEKFRSVETSAVEKRIETKSYFYDYAI